MGYKIDRMSRKMEERGKSRERDRSRNKYEKQIEVQKTKLEKKTQKIQKERQKLEKMQQKYGGTKTERPFEMLGSKYVIKAEFAQKIKEWEESKGIETVRVKDESRRQRQSVDIPPTFEWHQAGGDAQNNRMLTTPDGSHHHRSHSAKESRDLEKVNNQPLHHPPILVSHILFKSIHIFYIQEDALENDDMQSSGGEKSGSGSEGQPVIHRTCSMPSLDMSQASVISSRPTVRRNIQYIV